MNFNKLFICRYTSKDDVVELKGKVACEISSADELTLTEMLFSGSLKDATVEEMVAVLSCFVWQEKLQDAQKPKEELGMLFSHLQETARRVANVQLECKVIFIYLHPFILQIRQKIIFFLEKRNDNIYVDCRSMLMGFFF